MKTLYADIMSSYEGRAMISLSEVAEYFGFQADTLQRKVQSGEIKLPIFRMDPQSQKCPPSVRVHDFARYADGVYQMQLDEQLALWQAA